jgi:hypothetical protein
MHQEILNGLVEPARRFARQFSGIDQRLNGPWNTTRQFKRPWFALRTALRIAIASPPELHGARRTVSWIAWRITV